ncbi:hypothetical protein BDY24DRAFT_417806, partial [Mrakia frigida]|uniref:uncharacterized protein n=1 Tax=Mrakia frigida TaxID=29902 RepID=UPI003FCC0536
DVVEAVQKLTGGAGAHAAVVVASGSQAYEQALQYLRPHGALVASKPLRSPLTAKQTLQRPSTNLLSVPSSSTDTIVDAILFLNALSPTFLLFSISFLNASSTTFEHPLNSILSVPLRNVF